MKTKKYFLIPFIIFFAFGCGKKEEEFKIGAIVPLSGDNSIYGIALKKGMDLALEEIDQNIKASTKINIIYEDDAALPQKGVSAFQKLITVDKIKLVIGAMFSAVTLSIAPIAERDHIVLLSPTSSAVELTKSGDYIFRIYPSDSYDGKFIANFVFDTLKYRKAAIVYIQVASTTAITNVFENEFKSLGGSIILKEGYKEGETNFRTVINKLLKKSPELVFLPGYLKEISIFLKQAKELGLNSQFVSISTLYDPQIFQLAGNSSEDLIFTTPYYNINSDDNYTKAFVYSFRNKYSEEPNIWSGYGYDVVKVAYEAIIRSDKTASGIKEALYNIKNLPGVTGNVSFDNNGDVVKPLKVMQIKHQKFIEYN